MWRFIEHCPRNMVMMMSYHAAEQSPASNATK
jgi:hypothetical protein